MVAPIAPPDAQAAASFGSRLFGQRGHGDLLRRSIGDNRSTISVELLSPIALHDAQRRRLTGFGCLVLSRWLIAPIDWGQSIYHQCRAIVPNSSTRRAAEASYGFRLFGAVAVAYRSDRLGTIDLPWKRTLETNSQHCDFLFIR